MAEKIKKISITALEKSIGGLKKEEPVIKEWNGLQLAISPSLSFLEMLCFVDRVVDLCFNQSTYEYLPEVKKFAVGYNILDFYTNCSLPTGIEKQYKLVSGCEELIKFVCENIDKNQLKDILDSIDKKIENKALARVDALTVQMNQLYGIVNNIATQFEQIYSGISEEEMKKLVMTMTDGKFDESKVVDAYFEKKKESDQ